MYIGGALKCISGALKYKSVNYFRHRLPKDCPVNRGQDFIIYKLGFYHISITAMRHSNINPQITIDTKNSEPRNRLS